MVEKTPGQILFEEWCFQCKWRHPVTGDELLEFEYQHPKLRESWERTASAINDSVRLPSRSLIRKFRL